MYYCIFDDHHVLCYTSSTAYNHCSNLARNDIILLDNFKEKFSQRNLCMKERTSKRDACNLTPAPQLRLQRGTPQLRQRVFTCWIFYQFLPVFIYAGFPCFWALIYAAEAELVVSLRPPDYSGDRWSQGWPYLLTKRKVGHLSPCSICMFFASLKLFVMFFHFAIRRASESADCWILRLKLWRSCLL